MPLLRATVKGEQLVLRRLLIRLTWDTVSGMYRHSHSNPSVRNLINETHLSTPHRKQLQLPRGHLTLNAQFHEVISWTHISDSNPDEQDQGCVSKRHSHFIASTFGFPVSAFRRQLWHVKNKNSKKHELELRDICVSKDKALSGCTAWAWSAAQTRIV